MSRTRRLAVRLDEVTVSPRWADSELRVRQYNSGVEREAVITIRAPSDVHELRVALDRIENNWRGALEGAKP